MRKNNEGKYNSANNIECLKLLTGANVQWNEHQKGDGVQFERLLLQSRSLFRSVDTYTPSEAHATTLF